MSKKIENGMKPIISDIKTLIDQSRQQIAVSINSAMTKLYWQIGQRINREVLQNQRAEYGKQIVVMLSIQLTREYGKGWGKNHLRQCMQFAKSFPDEKILYTLCIELSWSLLRLVMYMDDPLKRKFYIEMCKIEKWSVRTFKERIQSTLYERTALSKKPDKTIHDDLALLKNEQKLNPDLVFKDLDFLGLKDSFSEKDLETSIIVELQNFITELGNDFAFMERQKRIQIDNRDYYIDLLFYHRRLKCLVVIDLKIGEFEAGFKGQMELYLRYLEKHEHVDGENKPIGLILCTGKNEEHIELMRLAESNIRVAEYLTVLPPKKLLKEKLHKAVETARNKINQKSIE